MDKVRNSLNSDEEIDGIKLPKLVPLGYSQKDIFKEMINQIPHGHCLNTTKDLSFLKKFPPKEKRPVQRKANIANLKKLFIDTINFFEFDQKDFINKEDKSEITVYKKNIEQFFTGHETTFHPNDRPRLKIKVI